VAETASWSPGLEWGAAGGFSAVIFDLDGVLTDTASVHEQAWIETFEQLAARLGPDAAGLGPRPFGHDDYVRLVDGEDRMDGVRHVVADRGVALPEGAEDDAADALSVRGVARAKDERYRAVLARDGPRAFASSRPLLEDLGARGVDVAVVSASRHCAEVLEAAGLTPLVVARVDGWVAHAMGLPGKPDPALFLEAARRLGVDPVHAVVVEDALAGVEAGRRGGFGLVVGIDRRGGGGESLSKHGADVVLSDTGDLAGHFVRHAAGEPTLVLSDPPAEREGSVETLTTLGNGYTATRGARPWAHDDGTSYPGTYAAGVFNRLRSEVGGRAAEWESLVNLPNWTVATFRPVGAGWVGEEATTVSSHRLRLDMRVGTLVRRCVVHHADGRRSAVVERRLVSMAEPHLMAQELTIVPLDWSGTLELRLGVDGGVLVDQTVEEQLLANCHLKPVDQGFDDEGSQWLEMATTQSNVEVAIAARCEVTCAGTVPPPVIERSRATGESWIAEVLKLPVVAGVRVTAEKVVALYTSRDRAISEPGAAARTAVRDAADFAHLSGDHERAWRRLWDRSSVSVVGEDGFGEPGAPDTGHTVALHLFHLLQVASPHLVDLDAGVGARGLHGEGYRGHIFWDTMFAYSVLNLRFPAVARALLEYRHRRLPSARRAAVGIGTQGALFPWQSGSDGRDETPSVLFNPRSGHWIADHSALQRHVGLAIAYEAWQHWQTTGDLDFLSTAGADLIVEVARCFAGLSHWDAGLGRRRITGVMGPDEFHDRYPWSEELGLTDNAYTNVMTSWVLWRARELVELLMEEGRPDALDRLRVGDGEPAHWEEVSRQLHVPFHEGVISQFAGYEQLEELDLDPYRERYGDIGRLDLILEAEGDTVSRYQVGKQADVLMLFWLLSSDELRSVFDRMGYALDPEVIPRTVRYYTDRVTHGSSLSRVVHAWVLARGDREASWAHFRQALAADIADARAQSGGTREGIHFGAMAGTIDLLQRCYTGLEARGECLWLHPLLPEQLSHLGFKLFYRGHPIELDLGRDMVRVSAHGSRAAPATIVVNGEPLVLHAGRTVEAAVR